MVFGSGMINMKLKLYNADATRADGTNTSQLFNFLPLVEAGEDIAIVGVSYMPQFVFNPELLKLKRYILIDYVEFGWDAGSKENRFGHLLPHEFGHLDSIEWVAFNMWVAENPPLLTFKRELQQRHRTETMIPIEYLCYLPIPPIQTKAEFDARPFASFHCFGYSHPSRIHLHADMIRGIADKGLDVITDWCQLENLPATTGQRHISIYSTWWSRKPIAEVMKWQQQSKISVSLMGAGKKSFRDSEAPVGSIMAMPENDLAYSYPWDKSNSIQLIQYEKTGSLLAWLEFKNLYDIYLAGQENIERYRSEVYVQNYVLPNIQKVL